MAVEFTIPGDPVAWQRAIPRAGGGMRDTPRNKEMKEFIGYLARLAGATRMDEGVCIWFNFVFPRPKSHRTRKGGPKRTAPRTHYSKPDVDNLIKLVKDALTGIAYHDDAQVCEAHVRKSWTTDLDGMTIVTIEQAEPDEEEDEEPG